MLSVVPDAQAQDELRLDLDQLVREGARRMLAAAFTDAWTHLQTGVAQQAAVRALPARSAQDSSHQHGHDEPLGLPSGQGRLVGAQLANLPIPKALAAALNGTLSTAAAAEQAQAHLETIAQSIN
jgi:hypothetical protein